MKKIFSIALFLALTTVAFGQKKVLIEHFSNASCSNCGVFSPRVFDFVDQNANVIAISYHAPFPYQHDSLHFDNAAHNNARIGYYGVSGTPFTIMEGNFDRGPAAVLVNRLGTKTTERVNGSPTMQPQVEIVSATLKNGTVTAKVVFISNDALKDKDLRGHIALIEKNVPKTAYLASPGTNSEQIYKNVMRQMYMPQTGHTLKNKTTSTGDTVEVTFPTNNVKSMMELRIVAFIQDNDSREVHQANDDAVKIDGGGNPPPPTSVQEVNGVKTTWSYNPIAKNYVLTFDEAQTGTISINDITGKQIATLNVINEAQKTVTINQLNSGIYIATFNNENTHSSAKLVVE